MGSIGYPFPKFLNALLAAGTYYIECGISPALIQSVMIAGDAVGAVTSIAFRSTNRPYEGPGSAAVPAPHATQQGAPAAGDGALTAREWFTEPAIVGAAVVAGSAWSQMIHVSNLGCHRLQAVLVVGTQGRFDFIIHGRS